MKAVKLDLHMVGAVYERGARWGKMCSVENLVPEPRQRDL